MLALATLSSGSGFPIITLCTPRSHLSTARSACRASALLRGAARLYHSGMAQPCSDAATEPVRNPWHLVASESEHGASDHVHAGLREEERRDRYQWHWQWHQYDYRAPDPWRWDDF